MEEEEAAAVARLALCSKLLYDDLVISQQRHIEKLKLDMFWVNHGKSAFRDFQYKFNYIRARCGCINCCNRGTADEEDFRYGVWKSRGTFDCVWHKKFEEELERVGLTVEVHEGPPPDGETEIGGFSFFPTIASHFWILSPRKDWVFMGIGQALGDAESVRSPELVKLKQVMSEYDEMYNDD